LEEFCNYLMFLVDFSEITAIFTDSQQILPFHEKNWSQIHNLLFRILMYVEKRTIPESLTCFLIGQRIFPLDDGVLLNQLEELAGKLGIEIRYGKIGGEESHRTGGLCRVKGQYVLIMHSRLTAKEKTGIIIKTLKGFEMGDVYVIPVIRELLNKSGERIKEEIHE
jgi:hypothetical protein